MMHYIEHSDYTHADGACHVLRLVREGRWTGGGLHRLPWESNFLFISTQEMFFHYANMLSVRITRSPLQKHHAGATNSCVISDTPPRVSRQQGCIVYTDRSSFKTANKNRFQRKDLE